MPITDRHPAEDAPVHASMSQFPVRNGELQIGGGGLSMLAERVGRTPFYAYDRNLIRERVEDLKAALPKDFKLHYAMKANPMPALVSFMAGLVDGIDVASSGELSVALDAGVHPHNISFAGPGKRVAELRQAVAAGVLLHVESAREVEELTSVSQHLGMGARVAIRVNPDFELKSAGMKMGGGSKPFGVDSELVPELLNQICESDLAFEGFYLFTGSQNLKAQSLCDAQQMSYELALKLSANAPAPIRYLNLGGGFGVPYFPGEKRLDLATIAENLSQLAQRAKTDFPQAELVIELGRYLVAEAGVYVARIVDRKVSRGQVYLVADGGLHHHLAASGNFGQVVRKNYPVTIGNRLGSLERERVSVVGPLCTPLDILADRMELPKGHPGDLVVVYMSGAYGASASPQQFLGHPGCLEVLV